MNAAPSTRIRPSRTRRTIRNVGIAIFAAIPILASSSNLSGVATATSPDDTTPADATTQPVPETSAPAASVAAESTMQLSEHVLTGFDSVELTLSVPEGWVGEDFGVARMDGDMYIGVRGDGMYVYSHPCQWEGTAEEIGPTVDDLAVALEQQPMRDATVSDIELDGFAGKLVRMSVPDDLDEADCTQGEFRSWLGHHQAPGWREDVYILDVNGTRFTINVSHSPDLPQADLNELESIVQSLHISQVVSEVPATTG